MQESPIEDREKTLSHPQTRYLFFNIELNEDFINFYTIY